MPVVTTCRLVIPPVPQLNNNGLLNVHHESVGFNATYCYYCPQFAFIIYALRDGSMFLLFFPPPPAALLDELLIVIDDCDMPLNSSTGQIRSTGARSFQL